MYGSSGNEQRRMQSKIRDDQVKLKKLRPPPPNGESLKDTADRVLPYYFQGSRLRKVKYSDLRSWKQSQSLIMHLENFPRRILQTEIPNDRKNIHIDLNVAETKYL
jgi:bisphosphoglycerate-dependent phosphoglycerate mutase